VRRAPAPARPCPRLTPTAASPFPAARVLGGLAAASAGLYALTAPASPAPLAPLAAPRVWWGAASLAAMEARRAASLAAPGLARADWGARGAAALGRAAVLGEPVRGPAGAVARVEALVTAAAAAPPARRERAARAALESAQAVRGRGGGRPSRAHEWRQAR